MTTCFCGTISQKACDQLEAAEAEFGAGRDESLGHGLRTAGNRHFRSQRSVSAPPRSVSRVVVGRPRDGIRQSTYQQRATPSDGGLHRFRRRRSSADRSDRWRLANPDYFDDYVRHGFPMGRLGAAEEVADVIVFLASPRAHWINGRDIPVDGLEQPHAPLDRRPF